MIELFFYIYAQKWDVGVEIGKTWFSIFYIYGKNYAMGIEKLALKNFGGKVFLHIAEKVPDWYRKWDDMLKSAASATQNETKWNVSVDSKGVKENRPCWLLFTVFK